ncbi:MAG: hypothetical protein MJK15_06680 [Colwellia sp.]|nr:hypothetical protein [Colwellia sp.]
MHKLFLVVALLLANINFCLAKESTTNNQSQPNIVVFLVDDMGLMDTSLPFITNEQGEAVSYPLNSWYHTPNMETRAAKYGVFKNS